MTTTTVWTERVVDARTWHTFDTVESGQEFCERHGVDHNEVPRIEFDVIDVPLIRFHRWVPNADGRIQVTPDGEILAAAPIERLLIGALPDWWQPS